MTARDELKRVEIRFQELVGRVTIADAWGGYDIVALRCNWCQNEVRADDWEQHRGQACPALTRSGSGKRKGKI